MRQSRTAAGLAALSLGCGAASVAKAQMRELTLPPLPVLTMPETRPEALSPQQMSTAATAVVSNAGQRWQRQPQAARQTPDGLGLAFVGAVAGHQASLLGHSKMANAQTVNGAYQAMMSRAPIGTEPLLDPTPPLGERLIEKAVGTALDLGAKAATSGMTADARPPHQGGMPGGGGGRGGFAPAPMPQVPGGGATPPPSVMAWQPVESSPQQYASAQPVYEEPPYPSSYEQAPVAIQQASWAPAAAGAGAVGGYLADKYKEELLRRSSTLREWDCKAGAGVGWTIDAFACPPMPSPGLVFTPKGREVFDRMANDSMECHRDANEELKRRWNECENPPSEEPAPPKRQTQPKPRVQGTGTEV